MHRLAQQIHQERIQAALRPRPESFPARPMPHPASAPGLSSSTPLLARLLHVLVLRTASRRA
jgi:hypothetical protein